MYLLYQVFRLVVNTKFSDYKNIVASSAFVSTKGKLLVGGQRPQTPLNLVSLGATHHLS